MIIGTIINMFTIVNQLLLLPLVSLFTRLHTRAHARQHALRSESACRAPAEAASILFYSIILYYIILYYMIL